MSRSGAIFIGLVRGINLGPRNKLPMAEFRALCGELGWHDVRTYIQSGNVVFRADEEPEVLEGRLEAAIGERFGFQVPVLVRRGVEWPGLVAANPFPDASRAEPNRVMVALSRNPPTDGMIEALRSRATHPERVAAAGGALWVHYAEGVGRSRLSPGSLDRVVGSPVTTRNWRTVLRLDEIVREAGKV